MSDTPGGFPITDWKRLEVLRSGNELTRREIIGELYERYRRPILTYLVRRGFARERAEDLAQSFFVHAIEHRLFEKADPGRGRFRSLMLSAITHFAANLHRQSQAQLRRPSGGWVEGSELVDDGGLEGAAVDRLTPEEAFEREWMRALLDRALHTLHQEFVAAGRRVHLEIFRRTVLEPALGSATAPSYADLAAEFGLTAKEVSNRLITAKRAYRRALRAEVALYARSDDEIDEELTAIMRTAGSVD